MLRIVLIRPGSTNYDEQGRIQGTLDIPLSPQGDARAQQLGVELQPQGISQVYCCPCQAALQTATSIATALGVKVKKIDNMQNVDHGLWQGMLLDDVRRKHPKVYRQWQEQPQAVCPPEGEMLGDAQERVKTALSKVLRKHKSGTIALVLPEPLATLTHGVLSHREVGEGWMPATSCGSWEVVELCSTLIFHRGVEVKDGKAENNGASSTEVPIVLN